MKEDYQPNKYTTPTLPWQCKKLNHLIKEYLLPAQDRWLSAEEALKFKVCDMISTPTQMITNSTTRKVK